MIFPQPTSVTYSTVTFSGSAVRSWIFPNGLSAQTCFVTPEAAAETARRLQFWDPLPHEALKVFAYQAMRGPCEVADFQTLSLKSSQSAIRWLLDKTLATTADKSDLKLTRAEEQQLADCAKSNPNPQDIGACWGELLHERAAAFQREGFDGLPPYVVPRRLECFLAFHLLSPADRGATANRQ